MDNDAATLLVGFATADITPTVGMERPGDYMKKRLEGVHDPVKVRASVFDSGDDAVVIVGVDTLGLPADVCADARARIVERLGIPEHHVMLAASHTHSGGPVKGLRPEQFADAPELICTLAVEESVNSSALHRDWVIGQIVSAVSRAHGARQPATVNVGTGREDSVLFNRRFRMRNGRVYTHPGKGNPDIVEPEGPVDPTVGVIGAWSVDNELLGCIVNYGCHCTTFSATDVSADYVFGIERTVQGVFGPDATVVYLPGAAGDVTQVDNRSMRQREFGAEWLQRVGVSVGAEVLKVLVSAPKGAGGPVAALSSVFSVGRRRPDPARLNAARAVIAADRRDAEWLFAKELLLLDYLVEREPRADVEVQAIQVGPAVLLANQCEYFASAGLALKAASPFPYTFVVTLANGTYGYMPPRESFEPSGGGYETVATSTSNLEVGTAERIRDECLALAAKLTPGNVPTEPRVDAPGKPWGYGVLGPDR